MSEDKCSFCGDVNIVRGIRVSQTAEVGAIGLSHQTSFVFTGTEPLVADLCSACGTVIRLRVRNAKRKWRIEAE